VPQALQKRRPAARTWPQAVHWVGAAGSGAAAGATATAVPQAAQKRAAVGSSAPQEVHALGGGGGAGVPHDGQNRPSGGICVPQDWQAAKAVPLESLGKDYPLRPAVAAPRSRRYDG